MNPIIVLTCASNQDKRNYVGTLIILSIDIWILSFIIGVLKIFVTILYKLVTKIQSLTYLIP